MSNLGLWILYKICKFVKVETKILEKDVNVTALEDKMYLYIFTDFHQLTGD